MDEKFENVSSTTNMPMQDGQNILTLLQQRPCLLLEPGFMILIYLRVTIQLTARITCFSLEMQEAFMRQQMSIWNHRQ
jgi:hypothetical protein